MTHKSDVQSDIERAGEYAGNQMAELSVAYSLLAIAKMLQGVIGDHGTVIDVRVDLRQGGV